MARPLIGITTYERNVQDDFVLPAAYVDAVRRAGGLPVLLPSGEQHAVDLLAALDGVIMSGGLDVAIERYGGQPHPSVEPPNAERDAFEIELIQRIIAQPTPLLAICRGAQVLNVALGGTLIEHVPDAVDGSVEHQTATGAPTPHAVTIVQTSRLYEILGTAACAPASWHHQAIRQLAAGLVPVAYAADSTIEAVELPAHPWLIGVQWHPEITAAADPAQQRLFDAFVAATTARHQRPALNGGMQRCNA